MSIGAASIWPAAAAPSPGKVAYGWWIQPLPPLGIVLTPADVPANGLYVAHDATGDTAVAAVSFPSDPDPVRTFTLHLTGLPVITTPLRACALRRSFHPVEGGTWTARPAADCRRSASGVLDKSGSAATFHVAGLKTPGTRGFAIFATGTADRAPFERPIRSDATFGAAPQPSHTASHAPTPSPTHSTPAPDASRSGSGGLPVVPPAYPAVIGSSAPAPRPTVAPTPTATAPIGTRATPAAAAGSGWRRTAGIWLGLSLALLSIVYWSDGLGAIPLRTQRRFKEARAAAALRQLPQADSP
jgi:hypothetical protein